MQSQATTPEEFFADIPEDRIQIIKDLRRVILENLPNGFTEVVSNGMLNYVVPHSLYSKGYHCNPKQPLPFMSIASQKNFIALYHMGIYSDKKLLNWFSEEYSKHSKTMLDMGKSCIRFKKINQIPLNLIAELSSKMTPQEWIKIYEAQIKR